MTDTTIHRFPDPTQLYAAAADAFVSEAIEAVAARGRFTAALAGGSTPVGLYERLAQPDLHGGLEWNRVEFFWGDERTVPPDHEGSNYRMARLTLLEPRHIGDEHVHRIRAERADTAAAASAYEDDIARCLGVPAGGSPPVFDLILLGLGPDGHTASLFPGTRALDVRERWVVVNEVPQLSTTRITMTFPLINRARAVHFLVTGENKAAALADAFRRPRDPARYPNHGVHPDNGRVVWFVDEAAASVMDG